MKLKRLRQLQNTDWADGFGLGDREDTEDEDSRVDFEFHPPKPDEMKVGVEVYYEQNMTSPTFDMEASADSTDG